MEGTERKTQQKYLLTSYSWAALAVAVGLIRMRGESLELRYIAC